MRQLAGALGVVVIVAAGCGGDDDAATEPPSPSITSTSSTTTQAAEPAEDIAPDEPVVVNADPVVVELLAAGILTDTVVLKAGTINFEVTNPEDVPHIFSIARGDSYEALPKLSNGAIDRDALGDDFIGKTGILLEGLGRTRLISFDLEPGNYVFYCNGGDDEDEVSHAASGEVLSVTVID